MSYWHRLPPRRKQKAQTIAPPLAPTSQMLIESGEYDPPFGVSTGFVLPDPEPRPEPAPRFMPPPPPWAGEEASLDHASLAAPARGDGLSALDRMQLDAEGGEWDPAPVGPPVVTPPLPRYVPPPVDWQAEEAERRERERRETARAQQVEKLLRELDEEGT